MMTLHKTMWDDYFDWIEKRYYIHRKGYILLLKELIEAPFEAVMSRDANRLGDGEAIREQYFVENGISGSFIDHPVSILEVLLGLAVRIDNEYTGNPRDPHPDALFWEMLGNLGLKKFDNNHFNIKKLYNILDIWLNREYDFNGNGGIFPLKYAKNDQKYVEIWDQSMAYLTENYV